MSKLDFELVSPLSNSYRLCL